MERPEYFTNVRLLVLVALADGRPRHAYRLVDELIDLTGWRPSATTVIDSLARLHRDGFAELVPGSGRQKPYRITEAGLEELNAILTLLHRLTRVGRERTREWRVANGLTGDIPSRDRPRVDADVPSDLEALVVRNAEHRDVPKALVIREALENQLQPPTSPRRVTCPHCHRSQRLTKSGRWYAHIDPATGENCPGTGQLPPTRLRGTEG